MKRADEARAELGLSDDIVARAHPHTTARSPPAGSAALPCAGSGLLSNEALSQARVDRSVQFAAGAPG